MGAFSCSARHGVRTKPRVCMLMPHWQSPDRPGKSNIRQQTPDAPLAKSRCRAPASRRWPTWTGCNGNTRLGHSERNGCKRRNVRRSAPPAPGPAPRSLHARWMPAPCVVRQARFPAPCEGPQAGHRPVSRAPRRSPRSRRCARRFRCNTAAATPVSPEISPSARRCRESLHETRKTPKGCAKTCWPAQNTSTPSIAPRLTGSPPVHPAPIVQDARLDRRNPHRSLRSRTWLDLPSFA